MSSHNAGITKVYNKVHSREQQHSDIQALRNLHRSIDVAVARAYGWDDLDLEHGFHEVPYLPENDRVRFTISETARVEVLRRLSELNRQRYDEEVANGLHADAAPRASTRAPRAGRTASAATAQSSLDFEAGVGAPGDGTTPTTAIFGFLRAHDGWHAKAEVLAATGITAGQWNAAISDLISGGRVERQGEKRGARYRIQLGCRGEHCKKTS
jgi:hypothetical protein